MLLETPSGRLGIDLAKEIMAKGKALFATYPNVLDLEGPLAGTLSALHMQCSSQEGKEARICSL